MIPPLLAIATAIGVDPNTLSNAIGGAVGGAVGGYSASRWRIRTVARRAAELALRAHERYCPAREAHPQHEE